MAAGVKYFSGQCSVEPEFQSLQLEINALIQKMDDSIDQSNQFIDTLKSGA